ncbi:MAG: DUF1926 domain-containing protein, partial [Treponema sp.]|nr:DUF1926 domain-containing protein [Treponema sp.]
EIRRCGTERFEVVEMDKTRGKISFIAGERESGPFRSIVVEKSYKLRKDTLTVSYTLSNRGEAETTFCFSPVIELSFPGDGEDYQRVFVNGTAVSREQGEGNPLTVSQAELLKFQDLKNETIITLEADKIFDAWIIPVYCAIPGEDGAPGQNPYQSTRTVPLLKVSLPPGKNWGVVFSLKFTN